MTYTVGELAKLAGVSVRTLRHYDSIGLLKPGLVRDNGYREYGEKSLLRLQQILLYRELGLELSKIREILDSPGFDALEALSGHRHNLIGRIERLQAIVETVDETIEHLKGAKKMNDKKLFGGLTEKQQDEYLKEAEQRWDAKVVSDSNKKWKSRPEAEKQQIIDEGNQIYAEIARLIGTDVGSRQVQELVERWRRHIEYFWTPDLDGLLGLADLYNDDPRFKANFDMVDPRLSGFIRDAVRHYVSLRR